MPQESISSLFVSEPHGFFGCTCRAPVDAPCPASAMLQGETNIVSPPWRDWDVIALSFSAAMSNGNQHDSQQTRENTVEERHFYCLEIAPIGFRSVRHDMSAHLHL